MPLKGLPQTLGFLFEGRLIPCQMGRVEAVAHCDFETSAYIVLKLEYKIFYFFIFCKL